MHFFAATLRGWVMALAAGQSLLADSVRLCVIVPCYNEEEMLPAFFSSMIPALEAATEGQWAILSIDDGSHDSTFGTIAEWHRRDTRISGLQLSRNFGQQAALSAGLAYAQGQYIGIMDCDLQDPVEVLIDLYRKCSLEEVEVCFGIRGSRDAPLILRAAYSLFYRIVNKVADHEWPRDVGDFCVMSSRCQQALLALPEQSRMLRGLRSWVGFQQAGIAFDRPARYRGTSKYSVAGMVKLALHGLISFSAVPLRLASFMGLAMGLFSMLFGVLAVVNRLFPRITLFGYWVGANPGVATILVFSSFALSVLFLCLGIVGEYLIVLLQELKRRPAAIVTSIIGDLRPHQAAYPLIQATLGPQPRVAVR
jgi:dolichol-phosphate mannosyltransferase